VWDSGAEGLIGVFAGGGGGGLGAGCYVDHDVRPLLFACRHFELSVLFWFLHFVLWYQYIYLTPVLLHRFPCR
jgi:hypothetical protein